MAFKTPIKILLVDDHAIVRDGIRSLLEENKNYQVTAEASNGLEALERVKRANFDLAILDINMEKMDGIACAREIRKINPEIKILALTMLNEAEHIKAMIEAGASGYILKSSPREIFYKSIETVLKGDTYYSEEVTKEVMRGLSETKKTGTKTKAGDYVDLTEREKEVLTLIVKEFTNQEIADKLFISVRTVDAHRRNLLEKTGARNTAGLVKFAIEHDLDLAH